MPILPVLDLMQGQIVRGIAGRRDDYRPIVSRLVDSAEPLAVAQAFRAHFGFTVFYLADLDAIQLGRPAFDVYSTLHESGFQLWIDAGTRSDDDETFKKLSEREAVNIVVGLESVEGPEALARMVQSAVATRIVFSLDLKAGQPLGNGSAWPTDQPWEIAKHAIERCGVRRMIVLDLARVGIGEGVGTESLWLRLKQEYPEVQLIAGGGVRGMSDVRRMTDLGVGFVLVASALHDGRITPDDLR